MKGMFVKLLVIVVALGIGGPAFGQNYYPNTYSPQGQGYGGYGQQYAQPGNTQGYAPGMPGYGGQSGQPGYGQSYPQRQGYGGQGYQAYPNYNANQGYGSSPGTYGSANQAYGYPGQTYSPNYQQGSRPAPVQAYATQRPARAQSSYPSPSQTDRTVITEDFLEEPDNLVKNEIYWDPNRDEMEEAAAEARERAQRERPVLREARGEPRRPAVQTPRSAPRPVVRRQARRSATPAPSSSSSLKWGKGATKPESKRSYSWGKNQAAPNAVGSKPGSATVRSGPPPASGVQARVETKAPSKKFKWGKSE